MAKVKEDRTVSLIIPRLETAMLVVYAYLESGNKTIAQLPWYCMSQSYEQKCMKQVTKNIPYGKVGDT